MIKDGVCLDSSETSICIQGCFTHLEDEPMARGALAEVASNSRAYYYDMDPI